MWSVQRRKKRLLRRVVRFLKEVVLWLLLFLVVLVVISNGVGKVILGALVVFTIYNWRRRGYKLRYLLWK